MEERYAFIFFGKATGEREEARTEIPVSVRTVRSIPAAIRDCAAKVETITPCYGVIQEFKYRGRTFKGSKPALSENGKPRAFILKRPGMTITGSGERFLVNDTPIEYNFRIYDVEVIELS